MRRKKTNSCFNNAINTDIIVRKMLTEISEADLTPEEDTAILLDTSMLMIKQIMFNTAIIADYCKANESKKGGTT